MKIIFLVLMLIVANVAIAQTSSTRKKDESPHTSGFVTGNGVRRNYLDWGGYRDVILFLTGIGDTAHVFDRTCECHFNSGFGLNLPKLITFAVRKGGLPPLLLRPAPLLS